MDLPAARVERALQRWPVARLATWGAQDRPHLVPVVFAPAVGGLWIPVDGKPKRGGELARVRNVRGHPRVCLLLDHYDAEWARLWWIRLDGSARVVEPGAPGSEADRAAAVAALRRKYPQYAEPGRLADAPTLIRVGVETSRSWCASEGALATLP